MSSKVPASQRPAAAPSHFRADVQGLRAVAVLCVVISHAGVRHLSGGYVGVDVFFVISGFLITQLLWREIASTGSVSLSRFWSRRARRILPAATVVLVGTALASALWLGPVEAPGALGSLVWAALFAENVHAAVSGTDYFDQGLEHSPVQHYWSLSVEEQFYIVWPLLILAVVLLARRRRAPHGDLQRALRTALAVVVALTVCASLAWSVYATHTSPATAYFSTFTRAWELALGAASALALEALGERRLPRPVAAGLGLAGLGAIAVAALAFTPQTPFPGVAALLPVLGTTAVLVAGTGRPRLPAGRLLTLPGMRTVGDWSYALYLWHWPVLMIAATYAGRPLRLSEKAVVLALALVLAAATTSWVERPFRRGRLWRRPRLPMVLYPVSLVLVLASAGAARAYVEHGPLRSGSPSPTALGRGWEQRYDTQSRAIALVRASLEAARQGARTPEPLAPPLTKLRASVADVGDCDYRDESLRDLCPRGDVDGERTMVVLGDSHGRHWIPALEPIAASSGYRVYFLVKPQCVPAAFTALQDGRPFTACTRFNEWAREQVARLQPDVTVVSTSPGTTRGLVADGRPVTDPDQVRPVALRGYVSMLREVGAASGHTVLIEDVPNRNGDIGACLTSGNPLLRPCIAHESAQHLDAIRLQRAAARRAGADTISPRRWFCDGSCPPVIGSFVPFRDGGHITVPYARHLAAPLARALASTTGEEFTAP
ncbi:acyltransferase family protein [Nocardioides acrostichi]|uniref:Acyltransferase n=1 Tax=Nocardioides acrostichi TaxID=2784339 RepID=A0A930YCR9_9ACTN|nr:acyltransferase family protein [Nocardioides acrostichi]MBF4163793.1 acyltransferase [Nocardioides acrostichi]